MVRVVDEQDNKSASPSYARRQALRKIADVDHLQKRMKIQRANAGSKGSDDSSISFIKQHWDISQRLLQAFQTAIDRRQLNEAYIFGLRFAAFGLPQEINVPSQNGRNNSMNKQHMLKINQQQHKRTTDKLQRRNLQQVEKVISMMEIIKQRMDAEEIVLEQQRQQHQVRIEEEERQNRFQQQQMKEDQTQRKSETAENKTFSQAKDESKTCQNKVEDSAMAKLKAMQSRLSKSSKKSIVENRQAVSSLKSSQQEHKQQLKVASPSCEVENAEKEVTKSAGIVPDKKTINKASPKLLTIPTTSSVETTQRLSNTAITPRTSKEQRTIDLLQTTIRLQEKRLDQIETEQIPRLVDLAKEYLNKAKQKNDVGEEARSEALKCVARKRALEQQVDIIKSAIFNMETQMFMIENAMEDRQIQKAMDQASSAMNGLQQSVGSADAAMVIDATRLVNTGFEGVEDETDQELLDELHSWSTCKGDVEQESLTQIDHDEMSVLTLPNIPSSIIGKESILEEIPDNDDTGVGKLLRAVLG